MSALWDSLSLDELPKIEDLLTEDEYIQLRYLACACVEAKISNDYGIMSYITYNVLRNWGYDKVRIVPAVKRNRTVATQEEAQNFFNPKYTDDVANDRVEAYIATVCIQPCKLQNEDDPSMQIAFVAITDLFMTPELDLPIYCMQKRNALSPLASVPAVRVSYYALLHDDNDQTTRFIKSRLSRGEAAKLDSLTRSCLSEHPGRDFYDHLPQETRDKVDSIVARFAKPFGQQTRPGEGFFKYFYIAMDRVKALGEYDSRTNTLTIKHRVE